MDKELTHNPDTGEDLRCQEQGCDIEIVYEDDETIQTVCRRCGAEFYEDKEPTP